MTMNAAHHDWTHVSDHLVRSSAVLAHPSAASDADQRYPRASNTPIRRSSVGTNKRFAAVLPVAAVLVSRPALTLGLGILAAFLAAVVSPHYGLSAAIATFALWYVCIDRRFLEYLLLSPHVVQGYGVVLGPAVGVAYLVWASGGLYDYGLFAQQVVMLYTLLTGGIILHLILRRIPVVAFPKLSTPLQTDVLRPVGLVGVILVIIELARLVVGLASGALDYGEYGAEAQIAHWGLHTYFSFLPRLTGTCFFLLPAAWRAGNPMTRIIVIALGALALVLGLASGSRTLLLLPLVNLVAGVYFFLPLKSRTIGYVILAAPFVFAPITYAMSVYRNTDEYRSTESYRVADRVSIFLDTLTSRSDAGSDKLDQARIQAYNFGKHLVGVSDALVYQMTPSDRPYAGWENIDRTLWVWVPKFFVRSKPYMQDGNDIVVEYTGIRFARSAGTISLPADLYRRFGWWGVAIGAPLSVLIVALYWRMTFRTLLYTNAVTGVLLLQVAISMLTLGTGSTLLTNINEWLYAIPKHIIAGLLLYGLATIAMGASRARGLASYAAVADAPSR
jgi:hypothetical protein